jgi:hypothetical protein
MPMTRADYEAKEKWMREHEDDLRPNAWLSNPKILKSFIPTGNVAVDDLEVSARRTMRLYNKLVRLIEGWDRADEPQSRRVDDNRSSTCVQDAGTNARNPSDDSREDRGAARLRGARGAIDARDFTDAAANYRDVGIAEKQVWGEELMTIEIKRNPSQASKDFTLKLTQDVIALLERALPIMSMEIGSQESI